MRGRPQRTPEKVAEARRLRDEEGWEYKRIAEHFGIAVQTAHAWLADPDGSKLKARKDGYRGTCVFCGGRTDGSRGPDRAPDVCGECLRSMAWSPEKVIAAIQRWADEHGGIPPTSIQWGNAGREHEAPGEFPHAMTVYRLFGSFNAGIQAAGFEPFRTRDINRFSPEVVERIKDRLRAGDSVAVIAEDLGTTSENVRFAFRYRGLSVSKIREAA